MRKIRETLARVRPGRRDPRRRCVRTPEKREALRRPDQPVPSLPKVEDLIQDHKNAEAAEARGDLVSAEICSDRARRGGIRLAAHRWSESPPLIPMAESAARYFHLEVVGDQLPDGTVVARVPTLRAAIELYRLRWCCGADLTTCGDEHECRTDSPLQRTRYRQNYRTAIDLVKHGNSLGVCLECAGIPDGAECPTALLVEAYTFPLPDDLHPAMIAISELPR